MTKTRLLPKTHCKHGHEFTIANTWRSTGVRQGMRQCRACRRRTCQRQKPAWRQQRSASGRCRTCSARLDDPAVCELCSLSGSRSDASGAAVLGSL
jgi:hypothetical protein